MRTGARIDLQTDVCQLKPLFSELNYYKINTFLMIFGLYSRLGLLKLILICNKHKM